MLPDLTAAGWTSEVLDAAADRESTYAGFVRDFNHLAVDKSQRMQMARPPRLIIGHSILRQLTYWNYALTHEDWTNYIYTFLHKRKISDAGVHVLFDITIRFDSTCMLCSLVSFFLFNRFS